MSLFLSYSSFSSSSKKNSDNQNAWAISGASYFFLLLFKRDIFIGRWGGSSWGKKKLGDASPNIFSSLFEKKESVWDCIVYAKQRKRNIIKCSWVHMSKYLTYEIMITSCKQPWAFHFVKFVSVDLSKPMYNRTLRASYGLSIVCKNAFNNLHLHFDLTGSRVGQHWMVSWQMLEKNGQICTWSITSGPSTGSK